VESERLEATETKRCHRCGETKPVAEFTSDRSRHDGRSYRCRLCQRASVSETIKKRNRERAARQRKWAKKNPEKVAAHATVHRAVLSGALARPDACEQCGKRSKLHAHHEDHSKPLEVRWLCPPCHREIHGEVRVAA